MFYSKGQPFFSLQHGCYGVGPEPKGLGLLDYALHR